MLTKNVNNNLIYYSPLQNNHFLLYVTGRYAVSKRHNFLLPNTCSSTANTHQNRQKKICKLITLHNGILRGCHALFTVTASTNGGRTNTANYPPDPVRKTAPDIELGPVARRLNRSHTAAAPRALPPAEMVQYVCVYNVRLSTHEWNCAVNVLIHLRGSMRRRWLIFITPLDDKHDD